MCIIVNVLNCSAVSDSLWPHGLQPTGLLCPWESPGKHSGVGCHFLLQGIFPTQGSNLRILHWQVDSLPLAPLRTPTIFHIYVFFLNRLSYDSTSKWRGRFFRIIQLISPVPGFLVPSELVLCYICTLWGTGTLSRVRACHPGVSHPQRTCTQSPWGPASWPAVTTPSRAADWEGEPLPSLSEFPFSLLNHTASCLFPPDEELLASSHQGFQAGRKQEPGRRLSAGKKVWDGSSFFAGREKTPWGDENWRSCVLWHVLRALVHPACFCFVFPARPKIPSGQCFSPKAACWCLQGDSKN